MRGFWTLYLVIGFLGLLPSQLGATSTGGAVVRSVNATDGVVVAGSAAGINGSGWETDEALEGGGNIDWYITWDDAYLYLGRVGGDNAAGSVIYLQAAYAGASFANRGFNYSQLEPELSAMGGVNFAAHFSTTVAEYTTYGGSWSGPQAAPTPQFSSQGNGDHFEVAIPWSAVTAGNGRPSSLRLVLYQVATGVVGCAQEFISAESPWGTGNTGDGPNLAVNDGAPLSLRQPSGCDVGDSAATRWWGCYPAIGGVGPNDWGPLMPDAGPDDSICQSAAAYFLAGNAPSGQSTGTWLVAAQPPGSPAVIFANPNAPNTLIQNLLGIGTYAFVWQFDYGGCPAQPDTVLLTRIVTAPTATTMADTVLACSGDSAFLRGNGPGNGSGTWTLLSGAGTIATPSDSTTAVTGLAPGDNLFQYTITNGICPATSATVNVYVPIAIYADAGVDQAYCATTFVVMAGNEPDSIQSSAQGLWTMLSGPSTAFFVDPYSPTSNVTFIVPGTYEMIWTVDNHSCPTARDTVQIVNYVAPVADAGGDQTLCLGATATLAGNDQSLLGPSASYWWSQSAGPSTAIFSDPNSPNPVVQNLVSGQYVFTWWVLNGICPVDSDAVSVTIVDLQADGIVAEVLPDSGMANGSIQLAPPLNGNAPYLYSIDGLNFAGNDLFSDLAAGTYTFHFLDANGCSDSMSHVLGYVPPDDSVPAQDTIRVPTGFSPNGDGVNDTWEIPGIEAFPNAVIEVFNGWGGMVHRSVGVYLPWNGQRSGQDLPTAVYYFVIDLKTEGQQPRQGSLTILR